jgi:hypothetical protein
VYVFYVFLIERFSITPNSLWQKLWAFGADCLYMNLKIYLLRSERDSEATRHVLHYQVQGTMPNGGTRFGFSQKGNRLGGLSLLRLVFPCLTR